MLETAAAIPAAGCVSPWKSGEFDRAGHVYAEARERLRRLRETNRRRTGLIENAVIRIRGAPGTAMDIAHGLESELDFETRRELAGVRSSTPLEANRAAQVERILRTAHERTIRPIPRYVVVTGPALKVELDGRDTLDPAPLPTLSATVGGSRRLRVELRSALPGVAVLVAVEGSTSVAAWCGPVDDRGELSTSLPIPRGAPPMMSVRAVVCDDRGPSVIGPVSVQTEPETAAQAPRAAVLLISAVEPAADDALSGTCRSARRVEPDADHLTRVLAGLQ